MIINLRDYVHSCKARAIEEQLAFEIVHAVLMVDQCAVRAGTVQHNKAKADQKD